MCRKRKQKYRYTGFSVVRCPEIIGKFLIIIAQYEALFMDIYTVFDVHRESSQSSPNIITQFIDIYTVFDVAILSMPMLTTSYG